MRDDSVRIRHSSRQGLSGFARRGLAIGSPPGYGAAHPGEDDYDLRRVQKIERAPDTSQARRFQNTDKSGEGSPAKARVSRTDTC